MNTKKLLISLLAGAVVAGTMTVAAMACDAVDTTPWDGETYCLDWLEGKNPEGTAGESFYLNSAKDLAGLAHYVNTYASTNNIFTGDTVYLNVDVDLANFDWNPIGTAYPREKNRFYGSFDGQGHTISNLKVAEGHYFAGLFGQIPTYTYTQTFSNVTINNANVVAADESNSKEAAGALIGRANGTIIDNCHVTGEVYISGDRFVGGLLGHSYAQIEDCSVTATGTINADTWQAGGLVGSHGATATYTSSIENCIVDGGEDGLDVTSYYASAGGAVGSVSVSGVESTTLDGVIVKNVSVEAEDESSGSGIALVANGYAATNSSAVNVETTLADEEYTASDAAQTKAVAEVNGEYYTSFTDALKNLKNGGTLNLLDNVTFDGNWDCRDYGSTACYGKFYVPVTINGNNNIFTLTGTVNDNNHDAVFRFEADSTVKNLTVDLSAVTADNRFRAISAKADLTVDNCIFIGNGSENNTRAIIYGEGSGIDIGEVDVTITNSEFIGWRRGITDNENGQDAKTVVVDECEFEDASVAVSATNEVTFTGNTIDNGSLSIVAYSNVTDLVVTVTGNDLDETAINKITDGTIITDEENIALPKVFINANGYNTIDEAIAKASEGDIIEIKAGTYNAFEVPQDKNNLTFVGETASAKAASGNLVTIKTMEEGVDTHNNGVFVQAETTTFKNIDFTSGEVINTWMSSALGNTNGDTGKSSSLKNLVVENCSFTGSGVNQAIWTNQGNITLTNCTITNYVKGVDNYAIGADQAVVITDSEITDVHNAFHTGEAATGAQINVTGTTIDSEVINVGGGVAVAISESTISNADVTSYATSTISVTESALYDTSFAMDEFATGAITLSAVFANNINSIAAAAEADENITITTYYPTVEDYEGDEQPVEVPNIADAIYVEFVKADVDADGNDTEEGEDLYNINLVAKEETINRLNSVDLTFVLTQENGKNEFEIIASNDEIVINPVNNSTTRYEFHYNGKDGVKTDTGATITIGQVKFTGYGKFDFAVDATATTNAAHATTLGDNIVDTFIPDGDTTAVADGELVIDDAMIDDVVIVTPTRDLTINIDFPNTITNNALAYQAMKVTVTGEDLEQALVIDLGTDSTVSDLAVYANKEAADVTVENVYTITIKNLLTVNTAYTVTVEGEGYRTARYTVNMQETDKTLNFWNNVKDNAVEVEEEKASSAKNVTFLAGDIVKDSTINIYDLSAVVSYFGEIDLNVAGTANAYAKYDLNRDGKIDSKDVAYVLVSWEN